MLKILLIDDEPNIVQDMLSMFGYEVDTAMDGFEGIQKLQSAQKNYNLVILDIMMPKMDGWSVLKLIREDEEEKNNVPIIMLTSCDDEKLEVAGLRRGADNYLTKPIKPSTLLAHIEALSRRAKWENENALKKTDTNNEENPYTASANLLTQRERELLKYIVQGDSNQKIGKKLVISETTVKNHLAHIFKKLSVSNRTQAAYVAQKYKLC